MKSSKSNGTTLLLGMSLVLMVGASACSASDTSSDGETASDGEVTITVGNRPTADQAETRAEFDAQVSAFTAANPNITIEATETKYDPQTFQTQLAGDTLPDAMLVAFTEPKALIANGQIANITEEVTDQDILDSLNPTTLAIAQNDEGDVFGVPVGAYAVGLNYNRDLFTQAGLDPDSPPTTWEEVRTYAKTIAEKTGAAGYAQMSAKNCGGWMFTAMTYGFGGRLQNDEGTAAVFADTAGSADALEAIRQMKWTDNSMGENNLYDCDSIVQDFAAGKIGMYLKAPDDFKTVTVQYDMDPKSFGSAGMPDGNGSENGTLTGGDIAIVNPKASDEEKSAAVQWINFLYLTKYTDEEVAVSGAEAAAAAGSPVAIPGLPVVSEQAYDTYLDWVSAQNNVPLENFAGYTDRLKTIPIIPEPKTDAQAVYSALDSIIQSVLTDENADIPALLTAAQEDVTAKISR